MASFRWEKFLSSLLPPTFPENQRKLLPSPQGELRGCAAPREWAERSFLPSVHLVIAGGTETLVAASEAASKSQGTSTTVPDYLLSLPKQPGGRERCRETGINKKRKKEREKKRQKKNLLRHASKNQTPSSSWCSQHSLLSSAVEEVVEETSDFDPQS